MSVSTTERSQNGEPSEESREPEQAGGRQRASPRQSLLVARVIACVRLHRVAQERMEGQVTTGDANKNEAA